MYIKKYFAVKIHHSIFSVEQYSVKLSSSNVYKPQYIRNWTTKLIFWYATNKSKIWTNKSLVTFLASNWTEVLSSSVSDFKSSDFY